MRTKGLKADSLLKDYFMNDKHFADMINVIMCDGKQEITPDMISDYDSNASTFYDECYPISIDRNRDIIKKITIDYDEILVGIENQGQEKWNMPFRVFEYNALNQFRQWHHLNNANERQKHPPVKSISIVLYFGDKTWKGPRTYDESVKKVPSIFEEIARYNMFPIIEITSLNYHLFREKNNRDLVKGLSMLYRWKGDLKVFEGMVVSKGVALIIASQANNEELLKIIAKQEEEEVDMCESIRLYTEQVLREGKKEGKKEGKMEGKIEGRMEGKIEGKIEGERCGIIDTLLSFLHFKFGYISHDVEIQIKESTNEQLDQLKIKIFSAENEEDILKIIGV